MQSDKKLVIYFINITEAYQFHRGVSLPLSDLLYIIYFRSRLSLAAQFLLKRKRETQDTLKFE